MTKLEQMVKEYKDAILGEMENIRKRLMDDGFTVTEIEDMTVEEYQWSMTATHPKNPRVPCYVDFTIMESILHEGIRGGVNFEWKVQGDGGRMIDSFAPYNYTEDCWVKLSNPQDVNNRLDSVMDMETLLELVDSAEKYLTYQNRNRHLSSTKASQR